MTISRAPSIALLGLAAVAAAWSAQPDNVAARARALHQQVPLIDGHNDFPWVVREKAQKDLDRRDMTKPQPDGHTDIARLRAGGVGGQFWSVYVPSTMQGQTAVTATLEQIDIVHQMMRRYADVFELALTADDLERIFRSGKIASLIGMEGGHSIDSSLGALRMFHRLGARYMTLTHSTNVPWADSAGDTRRPGEHGGLTKFGEAVVREMNRLGMLVDLSHVSPDTMEDALRIAAAPVIFSHSAARAITDVPRNVPDGILRLLSKNGGVIMVTFVPGFISREVAAATRAQQDEERRLEAQHPRDPEKAKAALAKWQSDHPTPLATLRQVADHIDHIRKVAGIDHIGIGGDFDGIESTIEGLEDVSCYPALTAELLERGYSDADVKKILGLNVLRVMRGAEATAARLQKERSEGTALLERLDGPPEQ
jgi:membrane dipeptidase